MGYERVIIYETETKNEKLLAYYSCYYVYTYILPRIKEKKTNTQKQERRESATRRNVSLRRSKYGFSAASRRGVQRRDAASSKKNGIFFLDFFFSAARFRNRIFARDDFLIHYYY